jgi:type II secretory pathway component PulF
MYSYKVVTRENALVEGEVTARSKGAARRALGADGATLLYLERRDASLLRTEISFLSRNFPHVERIAFYRNLAMMLSAGLSIGLAIDALEEQVAGQGIKKAVKHLSAEVKDGKRLSRAMRAHARYFPELVVEMVAVGEVTGKLSDVLYRISADQEKIYELKKKVHGALAYPIVVVTVMLAVAVGLAVFVLPKVAELFHDIDAPLPIYTAALLGSSLFVQAHILELIAAAILGGVGAMYLVRLPAVKLRIHGAMIKMPLFGVLIKEYNYALFFRSVHALIESGFSLVSAVDTAKKTLGNLVFRDALSRAEPLLVHGKPLSEILALSPSLFPVQARCIVEVGERTGMLREAFEKLSGHYERSVNHRTGMMTTLLEPVLMVAVGIMVALLAVSIFLPIYQVAEFM